MSTQMNLFDWSELPIEIREQILRRLDPVQCHRLFVTCKSWWSAAMSKCYLLSNQVPSLMLSMHDDETDAHSFFSLSSQRDYSLKLPELRGKRICGSSFGWLITIDRRTLDLHLLNPFSRRQIKLPSPKTFPRAYIKEVYVMNFDYFIKVILSEDPSVTDDYIIMAIFSGMTMLAFCRPQKEGKWIVIDSHRHSFQNLIYYQEQFYAVNMDGALFAVEIDPQPKLTEITPCLRCNSCACSRYLVEWSGELLHVRRPMAYDDEPYADSSDSDNDDWNWDGSPSCYRENVIFPDVDDVEIDISRESEYSNIAATHDEDLERTIYRTGVFKVYKLVLVNNCEYKWKKVKSIGDCVLFVGDNSAISLSVADFPEFKGNRIYFTDDNWVSYDPKEGCYDLGIFNLEDETFESFYPNAYHSPMFPPIWLTPNL